MELLSNTTFLIKIGVIAVLYLFWKFILYGHGSLRKPLSIFFGAAIVLLVLSTVVTVNWKATLLTLLFLFLWTIPANYLLFLLFKTMMPGASSMTYRQFLLNYENRKKVPEFALDTMLTEMENKYRKDDSSIFSETSEDEWKLPKVAESVFISRGVLDNVERMKLMSELSLLNPGIADNVLNNRDLFIQYLEWKKQGLPSNVIVHKLHVKLGLT